MSRRAVDTCALTIMQRLDPSSETSVHDKPVHGGKSNSSSCVYCESHWIAAPREFMSKSITMHGPLAQQSFELLDLRLELLGPCDSVDHLELLVER